MKDALDRIEEQLVKSPLRADIVFQHEDLESVCRELRARRKFCEVYKDNRHLDVVMNDVWMRMHKELEKDTADRE